ncbi:MAG: hypothetical protein K2H64_07955 [Desulfovibrio sp.]|nr:hypothetical protein [Desulfovibrio sp.]
MLRTRNEGFAERENGMIPSGASGRRLKEIRMAQNCRFTNEEKQETYYILDNQLYYTDAEFERALMKKYNLNQIRQHEIMKEKACKLVSQEEFANELKMFLGKDDLTRFETKGILVKKVPVSSRKKKK